MIKLCEILTFNKSTHVVVAKFNGVQIQFLTGKDTVGRTAYIKKNSMSYEIVNESEYDSFKQKSKTANLNTPDGKLNSQSVVRKKEITKTNLIDEVTK